MSRRPTTEPMSAPARLGQYLYQTIHQTIFGPSAAISPPDPEDEVPSTSRVRMHTPGNFEPFLADVLEVKNDMCKGLKIPMELVDAIVDFAEYWPHTTTVRRRGEMRVTTGRRREEVFILRSYPLGYLPKETDVTDCRMLHESSFPTIEPQPWPTIKQEIPSPSNEEVMAKWLAESRMSNDHPCRKIVFTIKSHDQGWGGVRGDAGSYRGSYTWFDVGKEELVAYKPNQAPSPLPENAAPTLEIPSESITCAFHTILPRTESNQTSSDDVDIKYHFTHDFEPGPTCLQKNKTATKQTQTHTIVWHRGDDVVPDSMAGNALEEEGRGRGSATGEFVRNMKVGDVVTVWAKARFAAWVNFIEEVKIDVYWAV